MTSKIRKYVASAEAIYDIVLGCIEENGNKPMSATMLHQIPKVNSACTERWGTKAERSVAKLSDLLGFMWRKGLLTRHWNDEAGSKTRYAYNVKMDYQPPRRVEPKLPESPKIINIKVNKGTRIEEIGDELHIRGRFFHIVVKPNGGDQDE